MTPVYAAKIMFFFASTERIEFKEEETSEKRSKINSPHAMPCGKPFDEEA